MSRFAAVSNRHAVHVASRFALLITLGSITLAGCAKETEVTGPENGTLAIVSGNNQSGTLGTALSQPLIVVAKDASGKPIANTTVYFATDGDGTLGANTVQTNAEGEAETTFTVGKIAGKQMVDVNVGDATVTVTFTFNVAPGAPTSLVVVGGNNAKGPAGSMLADSLEVEAFDAYGNPVPDVTVTWSTSAGALAETTESTNDLGQAETALTLPPTPGSVTVTATLAGEPDVKATFIEIAQ